MGHPEREYGLPSHGDHYETAGKATLTSGTPESEPCPNCDNQTVFALSVPLTSEMLKGGKGIGHYFGCAACPFATPMIALAGDVPAPNPSAFPAFSQN